MIDVRSKKEVVTRKAHKCHLCREVIEKGVKAVIVRAKEDRKHMSFYFHPACNIEAKRIDLFEENAAYSVTKKLQLEDPEYPF